MNIQKLKTEAQNSGVIHIEHLLSEQQLVRAIQASQGHAQCFQSEQRYFCKEKKCPWLTDCKKLIAEWMR